MEVARLSGCVAFLLPLVVPFLHTIGSPPPHPTALTLFIHIITLQYKHTQGIPPWAAWLRYLSFVYWGFNLLLKIQFRDSTYIQCGGSTGLGTGAEGASSSGSAGGVQPCHPVTDLQAALQLPTNPNESPALEVGVLLGMLFVMRLLVYVTLRHKTKSV